MCQTHQIRELAPGQWLRQWPQLPLAELALNHKCASAQPSSSPSVASAWTWEHALLWGAAAQELYSEWPKSEV